MKLKDLTPAKYQCLVGACPGVYFDRESNELLIIGRSTTADELSHKIGSDEKLVSISIDLIKEALQGLDQ